jgi:hypothetical protein
VGLIFSEGTVIDRWASRNDPNIPFFYGALISKRQRPCSTSWNE